MDFAERRQDAVAEMAMASGIGAELAAAPGEMTPHGFWFGEDQARYILTVREDDCAAVIAAAGAAAVPVRRLGSTSGETLTVRGERPILVSEIRRRFEGWLPAYMAGGRP